MSTPIKILLLGKVPTHIKAVSEVVQPECQVIQTASTVEDAVATLPPLLSASDDEKIRLIIMGGGFGPLDFQKVRDVPGAKGVPWMRPDPKKLTGTPDNPPPPEHVAGRARAGIEEHLAELREGKGEGEVWLF